MYIVLCYQNKKIKYLSIIFLHRVYMLGVMSSNHNKNTLIFINIL